MNVQRLIDKYGEKFKLISKDFPYDRALSELWDDIKNLDKPQPVKVPQFVAEKIEYFKKTGDWDLFQAMDYSFGEKEIREWLEDKNNQETFARAWLDGYTIEEKRYIVKIKNLDSDVRVLKKRNRWYFGGDWDDARDAELKIHTRKELEEAGFGWVFDCPGIKIEEVKDE